MIRTHTSVSRRKAVVLLVVITLLALFAAMGLSFVFYAEGESAAADISSQSETKNKVDLDPELLLSFFLGQSLYGVPSHFTGGTGGPSGLYSNYRGYSFAENLYGFNYSAAAPSTVPFNGVGKVGQLPALFTGQPASLTYADVQSFIYYPQDRLIIDPQRMSVRNGSYPAAMSQALQGPYVGWNAPYTYPDMNNFYLGTMDATGELLAPSFFRMFNYNSAYASQNPFLPMDPYNPNYVNWTAKDPWWKYLTARPHPSVHPYFPLPMGGGDVKNFEGGPGLKMPNGSGYYPMDSIWMDLGWGVMTGPNGRKYKPMFAPLIISMDGKINVNACGNINGTGFVHASDLGLGPWEISLMQFFNQADYQNLFVGSQGTIYGKYVASTGTNSVPGLKGALATTGVIAAYPPANPPALPTSFAILPGSLAPGIQGALDLRGTTSAGVQTAKFTLPGETTAKPAYYAWPIYPVGWDTYGQWSAAGLAPSTTTPLVNHPSLYDWFHPPFNNALNSRFRDSNIEALLRYRGTGSPDLSSNLQRICLSATPSLNDPTGHNRNLITTRSFSFGSPVAAPWLGTNPAFPTLPGTYQMASGSAASPTGTLAYPQGQPIAAPPLTAAPPGGGEFSTAIPLTWSYNQTLLKRVNLNRPLTAYPAPNAAATKLAPKGVIDPANYGQFSQAVQDRQKLAQDIFNVLTQVTIGGQPALPAGPILNTDPRYPAYQALLWLAQLSVNIVDFIDDDNYITAFNWNPNDTTNGWVYGTEQPRLVINEVYAEIVNNAADTFPKGMASMPYNVNIWVELLNPLAADPAIVDVYSGGQGVVRLEMPAGAGQAAYPIYTLSASTQPAAQLFLNPQLGTPNPNTPPLPVSVTSYTPAALQTVTPVGTNYAGAEGANTGFYVIGPAGLGAENPFKATGANKMTPTLASTMTYTVATTAPALPNTNLFLQRLACPDLPLQGTPTLPMYNPYVTVDYFTFTSANLQANDARTNTAAGANAQVAKASRHSFGRMQPFAQSMNMQQNPLPKAPNEPQTTFFRHNAQQSTAPPANWPTVTSAAWPATAGTMPPQTLAMPFNWLVHLDRQVTSPLELLHVSAYPPYQLTQLFQYAQAPFPTSYGHMSMPAWFSDAARIYRALEFFDAGIRATAVDPYGQAIPLTGRIPGRVNINEIWDRKVLRALADPQPGLSTFYQPAPATNAYQQVDAVLAQILASRSPLGMPSPSDRPFMGMAPGNIAAARGIEDTILRPAPPPNTFPTSDPYSRMLGIPNQIVTMSVANNMGAPYNQPPPYVKMELMNKLFNNVTCQSNVFAVWLTVGFFDVTDGPLNTTTGQALVAQAVGTNSVTVAAGSVTVQLDPLGFPTLTGTQMGVPWIIRRGCGIWVDNEPMSVKSVSGAGAGPYTITFTQSFASAHAPGAAIGMKGVLGAEVGLSEGRNVRHRMFSIVDRSALSIPSSLTTAPKAVLHKSATAAPPAATSVIALPQGQIGVNYPSASSPSGYTAFVPGGPFKAETGIVRNGGLTGLTGLTYTVLNDSSFVTFAGTPVPSLTIPPTPTVYFTISLTPKAGGKKVKQYFKVSIPQTAAVPLNQISGAANVNFPAQSSPPIGPSLNANYNWKIQQGMTLTISGFDANNPTVPIQETILVQAVNTTTNTITATFANAYSAGAVILLPGQPGAVPYSILGNPGPQPLFDHRQNTALVPHYSIIQ